MIHQLFSIYDTKTCVYDPPFYSRSIGEAKRTLMEALKQGNSMFAKYPDDYMLYHLGEYDDSTADFMVTAPVSLGSLSMYAPKFGLVDDPEGRN